jgi:uncharacterized protein (DUF1501 family)
MKRTRRDFLRDSCGLLSAAALTAGLKQFGLVNAYASAATPSDYKALVCIFLNGGNDGNNMVVPMGAGYTAYQTVRNTSGLAIAEASLAALNNPPSMGGATFGFHPNLVELRDLFNLQKLAVVCNVGPLVYPMTRTQYQNNSVPKPYQLFSHSDQVTQAQTAVANLKTQTGWGGRMADRMGSFNNGNSFPMVTSIAGINVFNAGATARALGISDSNTPLPNVLTLSGFGTAADEVARRNSFDYLRTIDRANLLVAATGDAVQQAINIDVAFNDDPVLTTVFPNTTLGRQLKQVAKVMKLNYNSATLSLNRQIFFCNLGGFDTHQNQPNDQGNLFTQVSQAMKAFYDATVELGLESRVTTFTLSDFGRTLQPSGSGASVGTDHGWGSHLFVMGGAVRGGDFHGVQLSGGNGTVFPTLQLSGPYDTDNRGRWIPTVAVDQYAATLAAWYGLAPADVSYVFPNLGHFVSSNLGFML